MQQPDRRLFHRYPVRARATLALPAMEAEVVDLSLGGFRVRVFGSVPWQPDDEVHFVLALPEWGRVKGTARVRWRRDREVGLQFHALPREQRERLVAAIQDLATRSMNDAYFR